MAVPSAFLDAVHGARWVEVDRHRHRVYVWKSGLSVEVYSIEDGSELESWPCERPTVESAMLAVTERTLAGY